MKKVLCIILTLIMVLTLCPSAFAAAEIESLKVNPYGGKETALDTLSWYNSSGKYFLFLPSDTDFGAMKVYFTAGGTVKMDGAALTSGGSTSAFTPGNHTLTCGVKSYSLTVLRSAEIPAVFMSTQSGSLDYIHQNKENKEPGNIRVHENGATTIDTQLKQIKGRGNSTWGFAKKPYNIKFDKKTSMLGMPKAKKWSLLASVLDTSLIRNFIALSVAERLNLPYTSQMRYADVYINSEYKGNYIIIESVEVGENRVEINDLEKANENANPGVEIEELSKGGNDRRKWVNIPENPADISGGYLLEFDYHSRYAAEVSGFVSGRGYSITVKSPEYASENEVNYIADYFQDFENAMFSAGGYNNRNRHFNEYIDLDSFAKNYVVQELMLNLDAGQSSFFMHKDTGDSKLVASPVWDFDYTLGKHSAGQDVGMDAEDPTVLYACKLGTVIAQLFRRHEEFRSKADVYWNQMISFLPEVKENARTQAQTLSASAVMDGIRWKVFGDSADSNSVASAYSSTVDKTLNYLTRRAGALSPAFTPDAAFLYYEANSGSGRRLEEHVHLKGDAVAVKTSGDKWTSLKAPADNMTFSHWNTRADGGGASYYPGDEIVLTDTITTLYAIWREKTQEEQEQEQNGSKSFWDRIKDFFNRILDFFRRLFNI